MNSWPVLAFARVEDFQVERLINCARKSSINRVKKFKNINRMHHYLLGRFLLERLYTEFFKSPTPTISYENDGRPFFKDCDVVFNIAHSGRMVVCGISPKGKIGVDVEYINSKRNWQGIADQYFSKNECDWLGKANKPWRDFYAFWVLKESIIKAEGKTVNCIKNFSVEMQENKIMCLNNSEYSVCWLIDLYDYYCSVNKNSIYQESLPFCLSLKKSGDFSIFNISRFKFGVK